MLPLGSRNLYLCGFMGSGKSTVGPLVAQALGRPFLDSDRVVEAEAAAPITEIFAREGEAGFRRRESQAIAEICERRGLVVALGGGSLLDDKNREKLLASGIIVHLAASLEVLQERLAGSDRPLLRGPLEPLFRTRASTYAVAQLVVSAETECPEQVAREIQGRLSCEP